MKPTTKTYLESFDIGVKYKTKGLTDIEFMNNFDTDSEDYNFFMLGYTGAERPVKATGWRYGEFTDYGTSKNHQSGNKEKGLSLMEVFVDGKSIEKASNASAMFLCDKKKVQVRGYYTPSIWGSDGEPLMLCAKHVEV